KSAGTPALFFCCVGGPWLVDVARVLERASGNTLPASVPHFRKANFFNRILKNRVPRHRYKCPSSVFCPVLTRCGLFVGQVVAATAPISNFNHSLRRV